MTSVCLTKVTSKATGAMGFVPTDANAALHFEHFDDGALIVVDVVDTKKKNRSGSQQRLQWLWNTQIGAALELTKEEVHDLMKEAYAVPILTRDSQEYADMISAVREVRKAGMNQQADKLKREIIRLTSTTDFDVKQMAEYLTCMEMFAAEKGARLTFPDDIYQEALGRKRA